LNKSYIFLGSNPGAGTHDKKQQNRIAPKEQGMNNSIVVYDKNHERVGETYPRRAKQLIKSGRASWIEEDQSLQLGIKSCPPIQEEIIMTDVNLYQNNNSPAKEPTPITDESNALLLHIAKQNVAEKRSFIRHIIAYIIAWPVLHTIAIGWFSSSATANATAELHRINEAITGGGNIFSIMIPTEFIVPIAEIPRQTLLWHFMLGVLVAWGVWITVRGIKIFRRYLQSRIPRTTRPDPVEKEYQRLMVTR